MLCVFCKACGASFSLARPQLGAGRFSSSLAPRIYRRLAQDIRHRYRRYRPSDLHRPGGRGGTGYGGHTQLAAGRLVDDSFDIPNHSFLLYIDVKQLIGHKYMEPTELYLKQLQLENVPIERLAKIFDL